MLGIDLGGLGSFVRDAVRKYASGIDDPSWRGWPILNEHVSREFWIERLASGNAQVAVVLDPEQPGYNLRLAAALGHADPIQDGPSPYWRAQLLFGIVLGAKGEYRHTDVFGSIVFALPEQRGAGEALDAGGHLISVREPEPDQPIEPDLTSEAVNPPPQPAPPPDSAEDRQARAAFAHLADVSVEVEFAFVRAMAEEQAGKSLDEATLAQLRALVEERVATMRRLVELEIERNRWRLRRDEAERQAFIARQRARGLEPRDEADIGPRGAWYELGQQAARLREVPGVLKDGIVDYTNEMGERTRRGQREAIERGDYVGASFANWGAAGAMAVESIDRGVATFWTEIALAARHSEDEAEAAMHVCLALLGLGEAAMSAYGIVEPIAGVGRAVGGSGGGYVVAGGGTAVAAASGETVAARLSPTGIVAAVVGGRAVEGDAAPNQFEARAEEPRGREVDPGTAEPLRDRDGNDILTTAGKKERLPINAAHAGQDFPLPPEIRKKFPKGVRFTNDGYPDFGPYAIKEVQLTDGFTTRSKDFTKANKLAGLDETPKGYTWHHHQDGKTLQLVPRDLHSAVKHTGGFAERMKP